MGKVIYLGYYPPGSKPATPLHSVIFGRNLRQNCPDWTLAPIPPLPPLFSLPTTPQARHAAMIAIILAGPVERTADEQGAFDALKAAVAADVKATQIRRTPEMQALLDASSARMAKEMVAVPAPLWLAYLRRFMQRLGLRHWLSR